MIVVCVHSFGKVETSNMHIKLRLSAFLYYFSYYQIKFVTLN